MAFSASSVRLPAKTFASAIRNHWAIENQNHWVRRAHYSHRADNPHLRQVLVTDGIAEARLPRDSMRLFSQLLLSHSQIRR
jgi:hypothetical protein